MTTKVSAIVRAEWDEKVRHQGQCPLYGWATIDGVECVIEQPDGSHGDPKYEVLAPAGYTFDGGESGLLAYDIADLRERVRYAALVASQDEE